MDLGRVVKWIVIAAIVFFAWKLLGPMLQKPISTSTGGSGTTTNPCINAAERASETWGGGIGRFATQTSDTTEWSVFRGSVEGRIGAAESACNCAEPSCETARTALRDLRSVVNDVDDAFRRGTSPPADIVQRQEAIDNQINAARSQ